MAGLAVVMFGAAAAMAGFVVGTAAAAMAVLVGPRMLNLVPLHTSAAVVAAVGCGAWLWITSLSDANKPIAPGDLWPIIEQFSIITAAMGYAMACATVLGASALWGSTIPGAHYCAKLLIAIVVAVLCIPFAA
nr:hypothetical protein [Pandoravirus massiliensis]